jgi:hypothetical protein
VKFSKPEKIEEKSKGFWIRNPRMSEAWESKSNMRNKKEIE